MLHGLRAHGGAVAGKAAHLTVRLAGHMPAEPHRAHRLVRGAAAEPGAARYRQADLGRAVPCGALGHRGPGQAPPRPGAQRPLRLRQEIQDMPRGVKQIW